MKNYLFNAVMLSTMAFVLGACSDDNSGDEQVSQTPIVLMGKAYTFNPEDAGEQWKSGKTVGIYMLKENTVECIEPYCNVKYQTTVMPEGYFTPAVMEDVIYYPEDGSKVDIIAYYPRKDNLTDNLYPMNVANQKTSSNFSFLYAGNGKGLSKDNKKTTLQLRPVLSQIVFQLKAGDGVKDEYLTESVIKVSGMKTKAEFNLLSGTFEPATEVKTIEFVTLTDENGASAQVLPAASTEGYEAEIKLPNMNRTFNWNLSEGTDLLKQGMRYICTVRVDLDKIEVKTESEPIEDWESGSTNEGSAAENWIQNSIEELPVGDVGKSADPMKEAEGTWWFQTKYGDGTAVVEYDEIKGRNVIHGSSFGQGAGSWYGQVVTYRMKNANPQVYSLQFNAKGTKGKKVRCYIKTNDATTGGRATNVFMANEKIPGANPYAGYVEFTLSDIYGTYSLDFNFSKLLKDPYSYTEEYIYESTPKALADFYIGFYPTTGGVEFYLDDVVLKKKN
jgi:hypothetical protein